MTELHPAGLTWCRQLGSEWKLCTCVSPSRQLKKQCRAAWESPSCWSCLPSSNKPSRLPFSIPCSGWPARETCRARLRARQQLLHLRLPSELRHGHGETVRRDGAENSQSEAEISVAATAKQEQITASHLPPPTICKSQGQERAWEGGREGLWRRYRAAPPTQHRKEQRRKSGPERISFEWRWTQPIVLHQHRWWSPLSILKGNSISHFKLQVVRLWRSLQMLFQWDSST